MILRGLLEETNFPPHVGDDRNPPKGAFAKERSEHLEIPRRNPTHLGVGDPVNVEDTCERAALLGAASFVSMHGRTQ